MIKLKRGPAPASFNSPQLLETKRKLEEQSKQIERQERFRFDISVFAPVWDELLKLSNNKCAYCESVLNSSNTAEVENFRPRAGARGLDKSVYAPLHYWWLAYEWDNLCMACTTCSQKYKLDFFPLENESNRSAIGAKGIDLRVELPLLIDPFLDDPEEHIEFDDEGTATELSKRGKVTIEILGLNRYE